MEKISSSGRRSDPILQSRSRLWIACLLATGVVSLCVFFSRHLLYKSWTLASLGLFWRRDAANFIISEAHDDFDVTFANYSRSQVTASVPYDDLVPPILHHIALGEHGQRWREQQEEWAEAVQSCLDWHPGWEVHLWTDDNAAELVAQQFPELNATWAGYRYPVQRIDALRYMVLYAYGGVVLDMDLRCTRALGPLRRFSFVAPEAKPVGFSIGFMMASQHNDFIGDLVRSLPAYDRQWLGLPYPTVMFSTGCHFASVVHAREPHRDDLKILPGPLHSLHGRVSTPLFDHLGSSSWHSYDAHLVMVLHRHSRLIFVLAGFLVVLLALSIKRRSILRGRLFLPQFVSGLHQSRGRRTDD